MGKKKKFIDKKNAVTYHLVHRSQKDPLAADEDAPGFVLHEVSKSKNKDIKLQLPAVVFPSEKEESVGLLNKAAPLRGPQPDLDPEIVATLDDGFDFDDPDNQLDDDFISKANAVGDDDSEGKEMIFGQVDDNDEDDDEDSLFNEFFDDDGNDEAETKTQFTNYSLSSSVIRRNEGLKLLDNMFEKIYEEYADDEIGALDQDEITGYLSTKSDVFQKIVDEYEKEEAEKKKTEFQHDLVKRWLDEEDKEEEDPMETIVVEKPTKQWDCESILSTYSNLYNHPKLIVEPQKGKKICISSKTGIPKGTLHEKLTAKQLAMFDKSTSTSQNTADKVEIDGSFLIRPKDETKEEKLARKKAVKEHRQKRREERKANTAAFKEEKKRQEKVLLNVRQNVQGLKLM